MSHHVLFSSKARLEFFNAALWWAEHRDADQAARWIDEFQVAIDDLADNPQRHALIHEHDQHAWRHKYHRILFGLGDHPTHRAIFRIQEGKVLVVSVRHLHQDDVAPKDFEET